MSDLISIITPMYNSEKYIVQTIKSVQIQKYTDFEMLIVDDNSSDQSVAIVSDMAKQDNRIKLLKLKENCGGAVARYKAFEQAKGRYIAFLDSDDLWKEDKLSTQLDYMVEFNRHFTYTNYEQIDEIGNYLKMVYCPAKINYKYLCLRNYIGCLTVIYDRVKIGAVNLPNLRKRYDYALWLQILKKIDAYGIPINLASYRVRKNSVSSGKFDLIKYHWTIFRKFENLSKLDSSYYVCQNIIRKILGK